MGAFLLAVIAAVGIAVGASALLATYQQPVDRAHVGAGARPDPDPRLSGPGSTAKPPKG